MKHRGGGGSGDYDYLKNLSEPDRVKVRDAFQQAWTSAQVIQAREKLSKANDEYRQALEQALKAANPEVPQILETARQSSRGGERSISMAQMPAVDDPEFVRKGLQRLGMELQMWARTEHRDGPTMKLHERILMHPTIREAVQRLESSESAQRLEVWGKLRDAYMAEARNEFSQDRHGRGKDGGPGSGPGPSGPNQGPPKPNGPGSGPNQGPGPGPGPRPLDGPLGKP